MVPHVNSLESACSCAPAAELHGPNRHEEKLSDACATVTIEEDEPVTGAVEDAIKHVDEQAPRSSWLRRYVMKFKGGIDTRLPIPAKDEMAWSWLGAFLSILAVSLLEQLMMQQARFPVLVASFGASAVLLYGVPESRLAQPRNFLGGQVLSALIGIIMRLTTLPRHAPAVANALGMSLALLAMQATSTTHPPGGATALIAVSMAADPPWLGFQFVLTVLLGSVVMLLVALLINNAAHQRVYPTMWLG